MKDLGKTKFYIGMQIEHFPNGVLVHRSTYIKKILKHFYMDKTHPLSPPMVVLAKRVKNYLVLKCYILVLLVYLCILPIVHDQILLFLSIY